ncbi:putative oxidoreductase [Rhodococcus wratislaviensis NBRC 100605]|uniref:Putative oxidoreductase n=1 Tax=Rhodococcus wratislaviensis NBRC 100605 TaxID=1219028 RepID=X0RCW8_RHOWR|nr:putative oxidoreductase [Rhodococcus wratislaviensis NBRC 100605]
MISVNIPRVTPYDDPRELETSEVELLVTAFARATQLAVWAGFDGVEIHADSGYLIHQFLGTNTNHRTDKYGGSPRRRAQFALEVLDAVCAVNGPEFVAIKLTPGSPVHDIVEDDLDEKYDYLVDELNQRGNLAFLHLYFRDLSSSTIFSRLAGQFRGAVLAEGHLSVEVSAALIKARHADMVGFGRAFIANPDLVHRLARGLPCAEPNMDTFYTLGAEGYTDYPAWSADDSQISVARDLGADLRRAMSG